MGTSLRTLLVLLFIVSHLTGEEVRLVYNKGAKSSVQTEVLTDLEIKVGDHPPENAKGKEIILTSLEMAGSSEEINALPLEIIYTLVDYTAELTQKGTTIKINLAEPRTDFFYGELKTLKGKPLALRMESKIEGFKPVTPNDPYTEILETKKAVEMLLNRLKEIFFLVGEPLKVGKTIDGELLLGGKFNHKGKLAYKITEITNDEVKADIIYEIPRQRADLGEISVTSGKASGKAIFSRENPLKFTLNLSGKFGSSKRAEGGEVQSQNYQLDMKVDGNPG